MTSERIPLRRANREIRRADEVDALLERALVGRLGTAYQDEPYVVPLNFVYRNGKIYFHSAVEGKKIRNLQSNPYVCFEVDEFLGVDQAPKACEFGARFASVIVYGRARRVEELDRKRSTLQALLGKYAPGAEYIPFSDDDLATVSLWEIEIEEKVGKRRPNDA